MGRTQAETKRVRYLLGLASPAEREHVESEYFHDADAFQRMLSAEDDLIDAYARGELSDEERRRFEKRFLKSTEGKDRVQFSRAFTSAVASPVQTTRPVETRRWDLVRIAAVAAVVVIAVVLSWLVIERRRMNKELRELRAAHEQLTKETQSLRRDAERPHIAEVQSQPNTSQPANLVPRKTVPSQTQREPRAPIPLYKESLQAFRVITTTAAEQLKVRSDATVPSKSQEVISAPTPEPKQLSETVAVAAHADAPINPANATLGNTFESRRITELPLEARNVPSLLSLQTATTRDGNVAGARTNQSNITLDGVDVSTTPITGRKFEDLLTLTPGVSVTNNFLLSPHGPRGGTLIEVAKSPAWIRLRLVLETTAGYTDYRATIKTAKGRSVMSMEWIEPITEDQKMIETPTIQTANLPAGNYKLILDGKKDNGSFAQVAEYSLKVVVKK